MQETLNSVLHSDPQDAGYAGETLQSLLSRKPDRPRARPPRTEMNFIFLLSSINREFLRKLRARMQDHFAYPPSIDILTSALLASGRFDLKKVEKHIRDAFARPPVEPRQGENRPCNLSPEAYELCKAYQLELRGKFGSKPDLHIIINSLLLEGTYTPEGIVGKIREAFAYSPDVEAGAN